jgi:hypothetical protein
LLFFFDHSEFMAEIYEFKIDVRSQPLRLLSAAPAQLCVALFYSDRRQGLRRDGAFEIAGRASTGVSPPRECPLECRAALLEFGVEIGEYRGVVRVPRRVFQRLLSERPTPERCLSAYYIWRTQLERAARAHDF